MQIVLMVHFSLVGEISKQDISVVACLKIIWNLVKSDIVINKEVLLCSNKRAYLNKVVYGFLPRLNRKSVETRSGVETEECSSMWELWC